VGYAVCLAFVIAAQAFSPEDLTDALLGVLFFGTAASFAVHFWRSSEGPAVSHAGATVLGCLYVGFGLSFCVLLRALPGPVREIRGYPVEYGAQLLGLTVAATWAAECLVAFLQARTRPSEADQTEEPFGWRAAALGFAVALGVVLWGGRLCEIAPLHRWALGALIGVAGMLGQRTKRLLQREAGIPQFDAPLSGHASVLAHFSGLLWSVPVAYFYAMFWL
jgi:CDP-diglyceride synthetase